jgi:hypothetical protein
MLLFILVILAAPVVMMVGAFLAACVYAEWKVPGAGVFLLRGHRRPRRRLVLGTPPAPAHEVKFDSARVASVIRQKVVTPLTWKTSWLKNKA